MPPAAEDPQPRLALDAYQAGGLRWLGGGAIAVVLGFLLGTALVAMAGSSGRRIPGAGLVAVTLVLLGVVAAVAGAGALLRAVRWRRALTATPWRAGRLRIAGPAVIAFEPDGFDELDPTQDPVRLQLLSTAVWRTRAVQRLADADVHYAPVSDREWVLTADGAGTVFGARTRPAGAGRRG